MRSLQPQHTGPAASRMRHHLVAVSTPSMTKPPPRLLAGLVGLGLAALFFGWLAATANPILIGIGAGLMFGPVLLMAPRQTIWVVLSVGLLGGVLSASPQFGKTTWIISILSFLLVLPALVHMIWDRCRQVPGYLWLALAFMLVSCTTTLISWYSFGEFLAGFKRYFQSFGLMLSLAALAFAPASYRQWRFFLVLVALLQAPAAVYELLVLVPQRGGLGLSSETTDVIAGTFGANLKGGSPNSVMVTYLFVVLAFLAARWRAGLLANRKYFPLALACALPLAMGETKIAVVMLPLVALVLMRHDLVRSPMRYLPGLLLMAVVTALLAYFYIVVMMHSNLDEVLKSTLRYNVGDQGYSKSQLLNRTTVIAFWLQQTGVHDPLGFFIGHGLGSSYTSATELGGHLGAKYPFHGINLTAVSTVLWDTGILGLALFTSIFIAAWRAAGDSFRRSPDPYVRADALACQAAIALFMLLMFYSDSMVNLVSMELIYAVVLGYLGYLVRGGSVTNEDQQGGARG